MSSSSPAVFSWTLKKCKYIVAQSPNVGAWPTTSPTKKAVTTPTSVGRSGRKSMATPNRTPTTPTKTTPITLQFDPLKLPGSSAKKVSGPLVGKRVTRDLSDLRRKPSTASAPKTPDSACKASTSTAAPVTAAKPPTPAAIQAPSSVPIIADAVASTSTSTSVPQTPSKQRKTQTSSVQTARTQSNTLVPPSPPKLQLTPRRQTTINSPSRLARTPTGQASPMHNAMMKNKLESVTAARITASVKGKERALPSRGGRGDKELENPVFDGENVEDDDLPSPSKRRRVGTHAGQSAVQAAASARKGVDLARAMLDDSTSAPALPSMKMDIDDSTTDFGKLNRPTVSARKINRLFQPISSLPMDPYNSVPAPPLVFTGPSIFYEPEDRGSRVFRKMVPPDDMVWGDPYALINPKRQGGGSSRDDALVILKIQPTQVAEANKKMERTKKRRLKRLQRIESGFQVTDPMEPSNSILENTTCTWDREFGIPVDTNEQSVAASLDVPDWQERLDLYHSRLPEGLQSVIQALNSRGIARKLPVNSTDSSAFPDGADREWLARADTQGIAIRVYSDA
ncbi:hypothetical protein QFC22_001990 [Naganishia vaughanmartiniae]|uniref:Uncharacterized protein n=1 Tax=Naganishia vaughanmartiniae TaxID=1424756 RepID=A0ACC2XHM7_9TREE|nr:hypothetical protein QFC22_001990 [Naganishia vaughanmartiniae]